MKQCPKCPKCDFEYTYKLDFLCICSNCEYEWSENNTNITHNIHKDANGNMLTNGDNVVITKNLKIKGFKSDLKIGTKVKNIRLVEDEHNIDCKIDGFGAMKLKSKFVKKI